ncbi:GerAB/ArcD/ProY family transporter [Brevibacillus ginsengisoli]|uniref:GerAB/ArcD/ProY family transporter n=1 Tax=Brevibacillus ginsengisoli TaxID=363854 RepID=UPI003CF20F9C
MEKAKISIYQLFALIVLFELGTAIVVPLGLAAKQDAWITILLGMLGGICLFLIYGYLHRLYPGILPTSYLQKILGKPLGKAMGLMYIVFFIYAAARDLRDGGEFLQTAMYDQTPLFALNALMILAISYILYKGIEVLGRTGEIYFLLVIFLGVIGGILILSSGIMDLKNLQPVLAKGWSPIIRTTFPDIMMFPFGETICFAMILPYLNKPQWGLKVGVAAMIFSGLILCLITMVEIAVLGAGIAVRTTFPLLTTISKVSIADFLQRLDLIVVLALIINDFFKVAIFFYAVVMATADIFRIQKYQTIVIPLAIIVLMVSLMIASNFPEHLAEGKVSLKTIFVYFSGIFPLVALVVALVRKRFSQAGNRALNKEGS